MRAHPIKDTDPLPAVGLEIMFRPFSFGPAIKGVVIAHKEDRLYAKIIEPGRNQNTIEVRKFHIEKVL